MLYLHCVVYLHTFLEVSSVAHAHVLAGKGAPSIGSPVSCKCQWSIPKCVKLKHVLPNNLCGFSLKCWVHLNDKQWDDTTLILLKPNVCWQMIFEIWVSTLHCTCINVLHIMQYLNFHENVIKCTMGWQLFLFPPIQIPVHFVGLFLIRFTNGFIPIIKAEILTGYHVFCSVVTIEMNVSPWVVHKEDVSFKCIY